MKAVFFYIPILCVAILLSASGSTVCGQQTDTSAQQIGNRINARDFIFKAQTALPQSGSLIQLTSPYDIKISHDTIVSYLPYYGRAFVAPMNPQDAGLEFTATDFSYEVQTKEKGEWAVTIKTKDLKDNHTLQFAIYSNGQAQLQVGSNNRQPIRFDGYVVAKNK